MSFDLQPTLFENERVWRQVDAVVMRREWAMPDKNTFKIAPIKLLLKKYLEYGQVIVDPFANNCKLGTITNDLNHKFKTTYNLDALKFLQQLENKYADVVLFDPPYSISQAAECYANYGKEKLEKNVANMGYWAACKDEVARILKPEGLAIICGWNSNGLGNGRNFKFVEILIVAHGGSKNDTIVTVEMKKGA